MAKLSPINDRELTTVRKSLIRLALASAAVTVLAAGAAVAQIPAPPPPPAPPAPPAPPLPPPEFAMGPDMMIMRHGRAPDPEKRAQRLRDVLQLRPDQDRALKAYVEATSPKPFVMKKEEARDGDKNGDQPTTLERLDHMSKAADAMKARAEATRAFYLSLSPSQQKTFDVLDLDGRDGGGFHVHRFDTRGPQVFKGERKVIIQQRKVG